MSTKPAAQEIQASFGHRKPERIGDFASSALEGFMEWALTTRPGLVAAFCVDSGSLIRAGTPARTVLVGALHTMLER